MLLIVEDFTLLGCTYEELISPLRNSRGLPLERGQATYVWEFPE